MTEQLQAGRTRRSWRRRLAFAAFALLLLVAAIELLAFAAAWVVTGRPFSYAAIRAAQQQLVEAGAVAGAADEAERAAGELTSRMRLHPFLGYVLDHRHNSPALTAQAGKPISVAGFRDDAPPLRRAAPDRVTVGVFGGSVAAVMARRAEATLIEALRQAPGLAGKRIELVRLAVGGFKQPQQLQALSWLLATGGHLDLVIVLDGFNDVTLASLENRPRGVPASWPRGYAMMGGRDLDLARISSIGRLDYLAALRAGLARRAQARPWRWSVAANLVWSRIDAALARAVAAARRGLLRTEGAAREVDAAAAVAEDVGLWQRSSRLMHGLCRDRGIRYFHFLQPNQYVPGSKPLSDQERRTAWRERSPYRGWIERGYPQLRRAVAALQADGVAAFDLTDLFAEREETLYVDTCCHLNQRGNELLAGAIGTAVATAYGGGEPQPAEAVTRLRIEPAEQRLHAPFATGALRVMAVSAAGEVDVTYRCRFVSADPATLPVDRWGGVEARAPGEVEVVASYAALRATARVRVVFPEVSDLGGGWSDVGGSAPRLALVDRGAEALSLRISGVDQPCAALLVVAGGLRRDPLCGGIAWVPVDDPAAMPVSLRAGVTELQVPAAAAMAVQVLVREWHGRCGWSMSNGLALRPR